MRLIHWFVSHLGVTDPVAHAFLDQDAIVVITLLCIQVVLCLAALLYARRHTHLAAVNGLTACVVATVLGLVLNDLPRRPVANAAAVRRILADPAHQVFWGADNVVTLSVRRAGAPRAARLFGTTVVQAAAPADSTDAITLTFEEAVRVTDALATSRHSGDHALVASLTAP